jgi:hypothetical protein
MENRSMAVLLNVRSGRSRVTGRSTASTLTLEFSFGENNITEMFRSETSLLEEFGDYTNFGSKLYPHKMTYTRNGKRIIEAAIESIEPWEVSSKLLAPTEGFVSHTFCDPGHHLTPPSITKEGSPMYPAGEVGTEGGNRENQQLPA